MNIVFVEPIGLDDSTKISFSNEMRDLGHVVCYFDQMPTNQEELLTRSIDAEILVVSNYNISKEVVEKLNRLKMIAVAFTGVDHIPLDYIKERGIIVCNAAGYSTHAVAELTIAMAIDLLRKITPFDKITREAKTRNGYLGAELRGKTFGILGYGAIGAEVASIAKAFGCNIIAWSRSDRKIEGIEFVKLENLLSAADIVSLHIPLNEATKELIGERELELMKPDAILINTARGPIVNSDALKDALVKGIIAGAAIDVYEHEPPIETNHSLFDAPNTLLLPHIGFATREAIAERSDIVLSNIRNWMKGNLTNTL